MKAMRTVWAIGLLSVAAASMAGCGGGQEAKSSNVKAGEMPEGESWTGVYFHPVYGYLHMAESDANVVGRWKRTDSSAWGELSGTRTGNVLHFTWKEHKCGMVGPSASPNGKGVFVYKLNSEKHAEVEGQFGMNDDETGSEWKLVKQQRMNPDLKSVGCDMSTAPPAPLE